ncbi:hypothetical protein ACVWZ4_001089 [Bradyrhizobium sp. USDA 4472]
MDGQALFSGSTSTCRSRDRGRMSCNRVAKQFGGRSAPPSAGCIVSMRPAALTLGRGGHPAEGGFGRPRRLAIAADQARRFLHSWSLCRARPSRPLGVGLRACREAQPQRWWLANAIDPRSRGGERSGQSTKITPKLSVRRDLDQDLYGGLAMMGAAREQSSRQGSERRLEDHDFPSCPAGSMRHVSSRGDRWRELSHLC